MILCYICESRATILASKQKCKRYHCNQIYIYISSGTLVPNSRDQQGKLWLLKKQKMALKTTLQ